MTESGGVFVILSQASVIFQGELNKPQKATAQGAAGVFGARPLTKHFSDNWQIGS